MDSALEFRYSREKEGNSECTDRCCQCHQSMETKGQMSVQKPKDMCPFRYWGAVHVIKVQSEKPNRLVSVKRQCSVEARAMSL